MPFSHSVKVIAGSKWIRQDRWRLPIAQAADKGVELSAVEKTEKKRDPNDPCLFCKDPRGLSLEHELAYSARDTYAVSPGHPLVIPRRHVASFFDLTQDEVAACIKLINEEKRRIDGEFNPDAYKIGVNGGP